MEHGWPEITIAFGLGALLYQLIQVGCILANWLMSPDAHVRRCRL